MRAWSSAHLLVMGAMGLSLTCACRAESLEPQGLRARYHVTSDEPHSLRYAVLWLEGKRIVVGQQGKVDGDGSFDVHFFRPKLDASQLMPQERLRLGLQERIGSGGRTELEEVFVSVYRPRVVAFVDENENGKIDVSQREQRITDRVIAIDADGGPSVALLHDPKAALAALSLENVAAFYATNPEFSDFVFAEGFGALMPSAPTTIELSNGGLLQAVAPFCQRQVSQLDGGSKLRVHLAETLDPVASCGLEVPDCSRLNSSTAPTTLDVEGAEAQCKSNGIIESLNVLRRSFECHDCVCSSQPKFDSYVVAADALPDWWPCGHEVPYCAPERSALYTWEYRCAEVSSSDAGTQPSADAGDAPLADAGPGLDEDAGLRTPL